MSTGQWHDLGTMTVTIHKVTNIRKVDYCPQRATADPITIENHKLKARGITQSVTSVLTLPYDSMTDLISADSDKHDLTGHRSFVATNMTSLLGNIRLPLSNSSTVPKVSMLRFSALHLVRCSELIVTRGASSHLESAQKLGRQIDRETLKGRVAGILLRLAGTPRPLPARGLSL